MEEVCQIFGWCAIFNLAVLGLWSLMFLWAHDWMYKVHGRWFQMSKDRFDSLHYGMMGLYKIAIFLFVLFPYLAMRIVAE